MLKPQTVLKNALFCALALLLSVQSAWAICPAGVGTASITHSTNINESWVELCSTDPSPSTVRLIVSNLDIYNDFTNMVITETIPAGMTYRTGTATVIGVLDGTAPTISNENVAGQTITWTLSGIFDSRRHLFLSRNWMYIDFEVYRSDEGLISSPVNYRFSADFSYDAYDENSDTSDPLNFVCDGTESTDNQVLPLREPIPRVSKAGWNVDASQSEGQAAATVYGNNNDDVI